MIPMRASEIAAAVKGSMRGQDVTVTSVATDSRKIEKGCIFIALKGERFDANNFVSEAISKGAGAVLCSIDFEPESGASIVVNDTKKALLDLASYYRNKFDIPVVGITGSVGKTTTKEFVFAVMSQKFNTKKTEGNLNNEIGLPMSVLSLRKDNTAAVFELGMSGFGEIERLAAVIRPKVAVITNIGVAHIEALGSREGILKAKMEIIGATQNNGSIILNADEPLLWAQKETIEKQTYYFGIENAKSDYYAYDIKQRENSTEFKIGGRVSLSVSINTTGMHNVYNALCAAAVGHVLGENEEEIKNGLLAFRNAAMRQDIYVKNGVTIINDCYNANPDSMKAAINVLISKPVRKIAVIADMLELGEYSGEAHYNIGKYIAQNNVDYMLCKGTYAKGYIKGALEHGMKKENCLLFENDEDIADALFIILKPGDAVLFKGSRGMKMENIIDILFLEK